MSDPFAIEESMEGEISVLSLTGYLDAHTAPEFERAIQHNIEAGRFKIVVDYPHLTYISSAGLGVFMGFVEDVRENGGDIKICGLVPKVFQVFELLGFQELYHIVESRSDAIQKFADVPVWEG